MEYNSFKSNFGGATTFFIADSKSIQDENTKGLLNNALVGVSWKGMKSLQEGGQNLHTLA